MAERDVIERKTVAEAARKDGLRVTNGELQKAADGFRALMDLAKARETKRWLNKTGLSVEALEDYLETNILPSSPEPNPSARPSVNWPIETGFPAPSAKPLPHNLFVPKGLFLCHFLLDKVGRIMYSLINIFDMSMRIEQIH